MSLTELELQREVQAEGTWQEEVQRLEGGGAFRERRVLVWWKRAECAAGGQTLSWRERRSGLARHKAMGIMLAGIAP